MTSPFRAINATSPRLAAGPVPTQQRNKGTGNSTTKGEEMKRMRKKVRELARSRVDGRTVLIFCFIKTGCARVYYGRG